MGAHKHPFRDSGPDKGAYFHELFVQGRPILSTMMKRIKIKGVKHLQDTAANDMAPAAVPSEQDASKNEEEGAEDLKGKEQENDVDEDEEEGDQSSEEV